MTNEAETSTEKPPANDADVKLRALIDRSARVPVLFFLTSSVVWLVVASLLGFVSSMKAHWPGFLDWDALYFLNFGRSKPAFINALVYGWALQAGLGVSLWLMARLCRAEVKNPLTLMVAGHFWNAGVLLGVVGILAGYGTSMELMDFPRFVWPILFVAYSMIAIWMITMFQRRRTESAYISQWYILGACFWFPWLYVTANVFVHLLPGSGVMAAATNAWFQNGLIFLVLGPIGLAAVYYLIPKVLGRPIHSYQLALLGFWGLAIFGGWAGMHKLVGGPLPAWMPSVGGAATILMLMPVIAVAINHHMTTRGKRGLVEYSPTFRYTVFGAVAYTVLNLMAALYCFFPMAKLTQLTAASVAFQVMAVYAFFSMTMFGAIYFIVPRLVGREWRNGRLINFHFWFSVYGTVALVGTYLLAGINSSVGANVWDASFQIAVTQSANSLRGTSVAWVFVIVANGAFLYHLFLLVAGFGRKGSEPTMLGHDDNAERAHVVPPGGPVPSLSDSTPSLEALPHA